MRKEITEDQITQLLAGIARAEEVDQLRAENERLRAALRWYADLTNYMPPVVVVFEAPPALLDKGALARKTLEVKP